MKIRILSGKKGAPEGSGAAAQEPAAETHPGRIVIRRDLVTEDRYQRFRLIRWWEQEILANARVLVIGAGALGNEVLKNLALLGVGQIVLFDLDRIEDSNLTRSVLFRQSDVGRYKADAAAEEVSELNPDCHVVPIVGNINYDLGLGVIANADVVIGCLDNIEARFRLNRACYRLGKLFIDAGLDHLNGDVRVYHGADRPCYECGLNEYDRRTLEKQMSCLKLARAEGKGRAIPTVPTVSSIIAGLQVQIAVRHLHGLAIPSGRRLGMYGLSDVWFDNELLISDSCATHNWVDPIDANDIRELPLSAQTATCNDLLHYVEAELGTEATIQIEDRDLVIAFHCASCDESRPHFDLLGRASEEQARCPECGETRAPVLLPELKRDHPYGDKTLLEVGIPPAHVLVARNREGFEYRAFALAKDFSNYWKPRQKQSGS
ncbi:MAG: ThiF family adenylyltransferase [Myxococcales bacterium]|nr:ThiF family adenylyltransferase [Myxococcales bacterium]